MKVITVIRDNMMAAKEIMKCIKLKDKTYFGAGGIFRGLPPHH